LLVCLASEAILASSAKFVNNLEIYFTGFFRHEARRKHDSPSSMTSGYPWLTERRLEASAHIQVSRDLRLENGVCRIWISMVQKLDID
jgi:hypothetical protein